ncbi:aspartate aminotransferase family protein [Pseudoalteromonas citrea]|uniref:Aspartate aminotransferase family protein n=1 Tax=Pseudoalteromonas citrea TaxID=43655 RepID=A0A5S3XUH5_9GAMM|nr:aminotransferase class III-fold pyridoxal phosphate-dependent enzyme [Pseudoalteromonas citrea]TMP44751.1 aspartate aminotransferase family protein [Pseudoalteromonas citrea]TMP61123.1 aspartate aminotransferase family protein [Pseudoalteromonas citrea]
MKEETLKALKSHSNRSKARLSSMMNLPIEHCAQGCEIVDTQGKTYLDCGGFGVFILGHRHPEVIHSVTEQLNMLPMSSRTLVNDTLAIASQKLADFSPASLEYTFFTNSGAESTELALKLARANGCNKIIALTGSYHGKTLGALSVTHRAAFRAPFEPLFDDVIFIERDDMTALSSCFENSQDTYAVILEPVQGEGGVYPLSVEFVRLVSELCKENNGLFIADEIQSGLARTGYDWAIEAYQVTPDIMLVGKGLSGGVIPCAAVVATEAAFEPLNKDFMLHSSTFGGSPIALAAAIKTLEILARDNISAKAKVIGDAIIEKLTPLAEPAGIVVRGKGLLIGLDAQTPARAGQLTLSLLQHNIITSHSLSNATTVRLTPSALLSLSQIEQLTTACAAAFSSLTAMEQTS